MNIITIPFEKIDPIYQQHVLEGWQYGCNCGESHMTAENAANCRKCRKYLDPKDINGDVYFTPKPLTVAS